MRRAALLLALARAASALAPLFGQYRVDGTHGGAAAAVAGPGGAAGAPPTRLVETLLAGSQSGLLPQPVVAADGTAFLVDAAGTVTALRPGTAAPLWTYVGQSAPTSADAATPALSPDGSVLIALLGTSVVSLDAANGAELWSASFSAAFTQPPTIFADGSGVVCATTSSVSLFNLTDGSAGPKLIYGFGGAYGPVSTLVDATYGNCVVFVNGVLELVKYCAAAGAGAPVWTFPPPEPSSLAPVVVNNNEIYMLTNANGIVYVVSAATGTQVCRGNTIAPVTQPLVYIGGLYAVAVSVPAGGIVITGAGAGCNPAAIINFAGTFSSLVVDRNRVGYFSVFSFDAGKLFVAAIDFSQPVSPPLVWNLTLPAVPATVTSAPALGADGGLLFSRVAPADGTSLSLLALYLPAVVCYPGEVSLYNGTCAACPAGTFSGPVNATAPTEVCKPCPAGSSSKKNSSSVAACAACAAGSFSQGAGGACQPCAAGSYGPSANASSCALCPVGTASKALGANSSATCANCSAGSAQPLRGASSCPPCAAGTYSLAARSTACAAAAPSCFTKAGSSVACGAVMPYAMFGVDPSHAGRSAFAGPGAAPSVVKLNIFSGQSSLPLSGLALGPSGGVVGGTANDGLVFMGLTDDIFAVSSANGAIVNNYNAPVGSSFAGSPAVASWGTVYVMSSLLQLVALPFDAAGDPLFVALSPKFTSGYSVMPPTAHSATRAVYASLGSDGIVAFDGATGARLWAWVPDTDPATSNPYACRTSPALDAAGARVFIGCDDFGVHALNASTGALLWSRPLSAVVRASVAVSANGTIAFASTDANNLVALDTATGNPVWLPIAVSASAVSAAPVVVAEASAVLVGTRGGVVFYANGDKSGKAVWATTLSNGSSIPPTVSAVTLGSNGTAFVSCTDGSLFSLRVADGAVLWRLALGEPLLSPPVLLAGGGGGGAGGALLLPSLRSSALFLVTGLSASASPTGSATASSTGTASATGSATATSSATSTMSASLSASNTLTGTTTSTPSVTPSQTPTGTGTPSASASTNVSSTANGGGNAAAAGLSLAGEIALSAVIPLVVVAVLLAGAMRFGRVRLVRDRDRQGLVADWRGATAAAAPATGAAGSGGGSYGALAGGGGGGAAAAAGAAWK